jgi:hypothetical protein
MVLLVDMVMVDEASEAVTRHAFAKIRRLAGVEDITEDLCDCYDTINDA